MNFYDLLGISKNASSDDIKKAYRNLAKKYHSDRNKSKDANAIIVRLNEAKEILLDPDKRYKYDLSLEEVNNSKQVSKNKEETFSNKNADFINEYKDVYISRWDFFINYLKFNRDNLYIKICKILLILINYIMFSSLKIINYLVVYLIFLLEDFIDYFAGFIIVIAVISLFVFADKANPNFIPGINANVEAFLGFFTSAMIIILAKIFVIKGSINLYVFLQNLHDKIFVKILEK